MGRLTGDNLIVLFIQPRRLGVLVGDKLKDLRGKKLFWRYAARAAYVEVHERPGVPLAPLASLDLSVSGPFIGELAYIASAFVALVASVSAAKPDALHLEVGVNGGVMVTCTDALVTNVIAPVVATVVEGKLAKFELPVKFDLPLSMFDRLVTGPGTWQAAPDLLTSGPRNSGGGIAVALRHDGPAAPLGIVNPLAPEREVAFAVNGAHLAARLNALAIAERGRDLALGFRLEHLTFEMDGDALVVGGLVQRRYGASRKGATGVTIDGRVRVTFNPATRDARVDVSDLGTRFHAGFAWAAALVAPALTTIVIGLVSGLVRDYGPKLLGRTIDTPLDEAEAALRGVFGDFAKKFEGKVAMTLHDITFVDGDLWLTGDVAPT